jgi:fumarate reductase subunit D
MFAVGGMVAAILVPVHILVQGVLGPLGIVPVVDRQYETFAAALANPLVKLYLLILISLPLFHWAHRFRYFLFDLGVQRARSLIAVLTYGSAIAGTLITVWVLLTVP